MKNILILFLLIAPLSLLAQEGKSQNLVYVCPPCSGECDKLQFTKPGTCPHCSMQLIEKDLKTNKLNTMTIAFYLQDGVEVLDFAGPMEVFAYSGYQVFTVSKTKEPIKTQGILTILPDYSINDAPQADILAFFGGNAQSAYQDPEVTQWIKDQKDIDHYFSVCTGAFLLAEAGMLKGKTATTFHNALDGLEQNYPDTKVLKNVRFVDNGNVITTAGISAGIDGALHLVAKQKGLNTARKTAYYMEYDKWIPGEGLILTEESPYENAPDLSYLKEFTGTYESQDSDPFQLVIHEKEKSLYASFNGREVPLFYDENDTFLNINDEKIIFLRNDDNNVIGYKSGDGGSVYKKLK